jgi:hypothetical protein
MPRVPYGQLLEIDAMGYDVESKPMLEAHRIRLRVLAPAIFYSKDRINLSWLEDHLNLGLERFFAHGKVTSLMMDFGFERLPESFDSNYDELSLKDAMWLRRPAFPLP